MSAAIWYNLAGTLRGRAGAVTLALAFVALMAFNGKSHLIDVRYAKGHRIGQEAFVRWNPISRIALVNPKGTQRSGNRDRRRCLHWHSRIRSGTFDRQPSAPICCTKAPDFLTCCGPARRRW